jgi:catechol 2,3-dioxygenase-like lactoylglutathione lyase family enzyme
MPRLLIAYPQALVSDVQQAADYYVTKLGFRVVYLYGEPPFYGLVDRDGAGLNLRHIDPPLLARWAAERAHEEVLTANIPADGVAALFEEFAARGVDFFQKLKKQPWGTTDFIVRDPDGNLICFASSTVE